MRPTLPNVAQTSDRTDFSDRSAANLINAVLKDMGIIPKDNSSKLIDCSKIIRERIKKTVMTWKGKREPILFLEMGWIFKCRQIERVEQKVRGFEILTLNFKADDYIDLT